MPIVANLETNIARVFDALAIGERIARDTARAQARIAPDIPARRFLLSQARQETFHALICDGAAKCLAPRAAAPDKVTSALRRFGARIEADLAARDYARSLVGMQVVFEGLGAVVLGKLDIGLSKYGVRFAPLRLRLLQQEDAHHAFGVRTLQRLAASSDELARLRIACAEYGELNRAILDACGELFGDFDAEIADYVAQTQIDLPAFLRPDRDQHRHSGL